MGGRAQTIPKYNGIDFDLLEFKEEVKAKDRTMIALANVGDQKTAKSVDYVLYIPKTHPMLTPILSVVALQLVAYYAAKARGATWISRGIW